MPAVRHPRRRHLELTPLSPSPHTVLLTFDLEDWFQVENLRPRIARSRWPFIPSRVQVGTTAILDLLEHVGEEREDPVRATFFVLGDIARKNPGLVREIARRGHEVASHGMTHRLCGGLSGKELYTELSESRKLLEDLTGEKVDGFRAPSFTVSGRVLAFAEQAGFCYDASYNSFAAHGRYGRLDLSRCPMAGAAREISPGFFEIEVTNLSFGKTVLPWGGGAYFRLMPLVVFLSGMALALRRQGVFVFYAHPWEADPAQPRVAGLSPFGRFKHYTGLAGFLPKLGGLLRRFSGARFSTCRQHLADQGKSRAAAAPVNP
ncbi:MAG: polysaccharide deacetylase family protein [Thermodesulfobacteriota bacterium]